MSIYLTFIMIIDPGIIQQVEKLFISLYHPNIMQMANTSNKNYNSIKILNIRVILFVSLSLSQFSTPTKQAHLVPTSVRAPV